MNINKFIDQKEIISKYLVYVAAIIFSLTLIFTAGSQNFEVKGLSVNAAVKPAIGGKTSIKIPPFGTIEAQSHKTPLNISFTLEKISMEDLKDIVDKSASKQNLINDFEPEVEKAVKEWLIRLVALGIIGALAAPLLFRKNMKIKQVLICAAIGAVVSFSMLGATVKTYDTKSFRQPRYSGMLSAAPWLLNAAQQKFETFQDFKKQVISMADNINSFQAKVKNWSKTDLDKNMVKALFISDIHNNPAGLSLAKKVIKDFDINFVVDAGDITDYGTTVEAKMLNKIAGLKVPYVYVPGNHDSENVLNSLRSQPNVTVLSNRGMSLQGLNLYGIGDPGATEKTIAPLPADKSKLVNRHNYEFIRKMSRKPDVLIGHNPAYTKLASNLVNVTLNGHTHSEKVAETKTGNKIINAGTAGGAGIRGMGAKKTVPISFKVLYFNSKNKKLTAVDSISFSSITEEFSLQRNTFGNENELNENLAIDNQSLPGASSNL